MDIERRTKSGSAIILAVVLTSLLAIIGVIFLLSSRVDSIATSAISDNKDLWFAVDTVVAQISEELAIDVFRGSIDPNQYADYPDPCNPWLASLEPNDANLWPHITDLYYQLGAYAYDLSPKVIYEHDDLAGNSTPMQSFPADADGDGARDSMWVQVPNKYSSKGKPIYAAVRIIDNGGMLNVNTGFKFDPCNSVGSSQLDINLVALSWRPTTGSYDPAFENTLLADRAPADPFNLTAYQNGVIWRYGNPDGNFTPYDISDELEMRYRFLINQADTNTRLESWSGQFNSSAKPKPFDTSTGYSVNSWFSYAYDNGFLEPNYAYRHIATTYNLDRVINPAGGKMVNINTDAQDNILAAVKAGLAEAIPGDINALAAQITANLLDYRDTDDEVTVVYSHDDVNDVNISHFGFERPCIYISEIAQNFFQPDANDPNTVNRSYAIELYKPYAEDLPPGPNEWRLVIDLLPPIGINWTGSSNFHVFLNDAYDVIKVDFNDINDVNAVPDLNFIDFNSGSVIELRRRVYDPCYGTIYVTVDSIAVPLAEVNSPSWLKTMVANPNEPNLKFETHGFQRDISPHKPIRRLWDKGLGLIDFPTIGYTNSFVDTEIGVIQAHPANQSFTNVGEFGQLFYAPTYRYGGVGADFSVTVDEPNLRINLADPAFQQVFKYLTVMDPYDHGTDVNETRIKGRININTAPWYVLAQLPWVSYHTLPNYDLARAIVDYRNNNGPFKSTGELMRVINPSNDFNSMSYYQGKTIPAGLLTPADGAGDKFEERDVIFDRISNLVTVRSDVFTAYILVRIGQNGPQKRVIAILDRSGVTSVGGKVKIVAIQPVPDPR